MLSDAILFWILSALIICSGFAVILFSNPIYSALSLVMTMVGVAATFVTLGAYFLAGVQTIVYTGAVMVLFVMVLMLFNINTEISAFSRGKVSGFLKMASVGILAGLLIGAISYGKISLITKDVQTTTEIAQAAAQTAVANAQDATSDSAIKKLSTNLFMNNVLAFEVLGLLILVIAIGVVALSRSKGGTHARD